GMFCVPVVGTASRAGFAPGLTCAGQAVMPHAMVRWTSLVWQIVRRLAPVSRPVTLLERSGRYRQHDESLVGPAEGAPEAMVPGPGGEGGAEGIDGVVREAGIR